MPAHQIAKRIGNRGEECLGKADGKGNAQGVAQSTGVLKEAA